MSFRYINPGYSQLIQLKNSSTNLQDTTDDIKSKTGVAYRNTSSDSYNVYQFAPVPENGEYWVKVDFYCPESTTSDIYIRECYSSSKSGLYISVRYDNMARISYYAGEKPYRITEFSETALTGIKFGTVNTAWLHIKWGAAGVGFLEFQINNKKFDRLQTYAYPAQTETLRFYTYSGTAWFSSVIISDEEISPYEELVRLPVASTTTDMSPRDGGGYIASDTTQTLLQAVDTTALVEKYGSDAQVTSIALVGNPAYEVDEVLGKLTSISKRGDTVTEHETIQLSASQKSIITSSFAMQSDTTIAGLSNLQFGWKASE